ncbi:MAG TPA: hypothetical protein VF072_03475 [Thermoleophilaceae bacterium]
MAELREHALVLYRASATADATLKSLSAREARMTVVVLAREEAPRNGCCDTRAVLWNRICRDLAREDLSRAVDAIGGRKRVEFQVLGAPASDPTGAIAREAVRCGADEIILADPRGSGLGRMERRRLRRLSLDNLKSAGSPQATTPGGV